jgi:hypothetical protein
MQGPSSGFAPLPQPVRLLPAAGPIPNAGPASNAGQAETAQAEPPLDRTVRLARERRLRLKTSVSFDCRFSIERQASALENRQAAWEAFDERS